MFQGIRRANNSLLNKEPELDNLVSEEKDVLRALKTLQKESDEAGNHILKWCEKEKDDLKDIFDYLGGLDAEFAQVIGNMANRHTIYRQKLKEVKILQEVVVNLTKKHAASAAQGAASLIETSDLKEQLRAAEISFECQKRNLIREGVKQKYQGWAETASKVNFFKLVGNYGTIWKTNGSGNTHT